MARPFPLAAPDGRIYAYACGLCHEVGGGAGNVRREGDAPETGPDEVLVKFSREDAERCCTCRACGKEGCGIGSECSACRGSREAQLAAEAPARAAEGQRRRVIFEEHLARALDRDAALRLRELLSEVSEAYICASWDEHAIDCAWRAVAGNVVPLVRALGNADALPALKRLHEKAGGWWRWSDDAGCAVFLTTAEWTASLAPPSPTP